MNKIIKTILIITLSLGIGGVISFVTFKHTEKKMWEKDYKNILKTLSCERDLKDAFARNIGSYLLEYSDSLDARTKKINNQVRKTVLSVVLFDTVRKAIIEKDENIFDSKYFKILIDQAATIQQVLELPLTDILLSIDLNNPEDALLKMIVVENYFLYDFIWSFCYDTKIWTLWWINTE